MKSLVTGGAGFIGSHLIDGLLEQGNEVIVLDNFSTGRAQNLSHVEDQIDIIECDLSNSGNWERSFKGVTRVFHLAALADIVPSIENPRSYYEANVNGTFNVVEACKKYDIKKLIYTASSSCYGIPEVFPTPETATLTLGIPLLVATP